MKSDNCLHVYILSKDHETSIMQSKNIEIYSLYKQNYYYPMTSNLSIHWLT